MSTEIETVPSPNSANATSPDQLPKPKSSKKGFQFFKKRSKSEPNLPSLNTLSGVTNPQTEVPGDKTSSSTAKANIHNSSQSIYRLITRELEYIEDTSEHLKNYNNLVGEKLEDAKQKLDLIKKAMEDDGEDIEKELRQFKKYIRKLKLPIPSKFKTNAADLRNEWNLGGSTQTAQQFLASLFKGALPKFHNNPVFENSPAFRDFEVRYKSLPIHLKLCLLCFAVFPEGEIVKKRLMVYWWIGEGFVGSPAENPQQDCNRENEDQVSKLKDVEQLGAEYFDALIRLDFIEPYSDKLIEPYSDKLCPEVDSCRMHPFVRSAVITLAARAKFFDFDANGKPKAFCPSSFRACLMIGNDGLDNDHDFEKIHLLFNVDETILEIKPEWFPKMRNVNVLCLGRWQAKASHHIEVEDTKFLEALSCMKHLKFLSLQGISRIMELPNSVTKLGNLTILDLRACHNLEVIPRDIGLLKSLTHLDLSECYLLDKMPKGLSFLKNLLVLKGFVVVKTKDSCSLKDLAKLPKLRKLSIFTGLKDFPDEQDLNAFPQFKVLSKLKVVWGGGANKEDKNVNQPPIDISEGDGDTVVAKQENHKASSSREIDTPPPANVEDNNCAATNPPVSEPAPAAAAAAPVATPAPQPAPVPEPALPPTPANVGDNKKGLDKPIKPQQPAGTHTGGLPDQLQKLDLQCFPEKFAPKWLKPAKLQKLKRLYIRGGQLCDLVGDDELIFSKVKPWNVEILRLKYLNGLGMNWKELRELFPELIYLEKVKCPKLTLFPCDEAGVWLDKKKIEKQ